MKYLFDALKGKFNAHSVLRSKGRKLYLGFDGERVNEIRPYTELSMEMVSRLDTFHSDIEIWKLRFQYHGKDLKSSSAEDWIEAMTDAFKDANVRSGQFTTCDCRMTGASGPKLTGGAYDASMDFQLTIQRSLSLPVEKYV